MKTIIFTTLLILGASLLSAADLPRVMILGDSISIGYGPPMGRALEGKVQLVRLGDMGQAMTNLDVPAGANGGNSTRVLATLRAAQASGGHPAEYLLLNCGLHDVKAAKKTGAMQVPLPQYEQNLRDCLSAAKAMGVKVIWVSSTPVIDELHNSRIDRFERHQKDVEAYNAAAKRIMDEAGVPVIDLHAFALTQIPDGYKDHVHFVDVACEKQGAFMAEALLKNLPSNP